MWPADVHFCRCGCSQPSAADANSGAEEDEDAVVEASLSDRVRHMIQRRHEMFARNTRMQAKKGPGAAASIKH
jgi:hypothetical protein